MSEPIDRIVAAFPSDFFKAVMEQMDAAFMKAARITEQNIADPERPNTLGQLRHACAEEGFRSAAETAGLAPMAPYTEPAGGRFSLVGSGGVYLVRANVQTHCGVPRRTRFRKSWAALNAWLDSFQFNLLDKTECPPADRLCEMLVVSANRNGGDHTLPAFVGLGIPSSDLSHWKFRAPLTAVLGKYHDLETKLRTPSQAPLEIKDHAIPKLKRRNSESDKN